MEYICLFIIFGYLILKIVENVCLAIIAIKEEKTARYKLIQEGDEVILERIKE